jgi:tetratricopeptide (TPR) repeat protein
MSKRPPNTLAPDRPNSGNPALQNAVLALQMQRPHEAERLAAGVLKSDRGNALAAQVLGRALLMLNRPDEAIVPLEKASRRSDDPAIKALLAEALAAAGRSNEGLELLREATSRRPPFAPAFLQYGGQLSKAGRFGEAIAVLETGIALTPDAVDLRMELGYVHVKRNDRVTARAIFLQILAAAPERYDVLPALAKVMAFDGEYAAAADIYRRALALNPDDVMSRHNLGICLLELGERDAGEASLREAVRGAPNMEGQAITSLAATSHGRFFLRPSAAVRFMRVGTAI